MAKKKKGLPFVVQPRLKPIIERLGTEESGIIEIERKGYLTVSEKAVVQGAMGENNMLTDAYIAARGISQRHDVSVAQVFEDISSEVQPGYLDGEDKEVSRILSAMIAHEEKLRLVASTAMIMSRVAPDWDPSDTVGIHPDLQAELYKLYTDEDRKCVEALEVAAKEIDKSQEGSEGKE
jgi:hypothetical protein